MAPSTAILTAAHISNPAAVGRQPLVGNASHTSSHLAAVALLYTKEHGRSKCPFRLSTPPPVTYTRVGWGRNRSILCARGAHRMLRSSAQARHSRRRLLCMHRR